MFSKKKRNAAPPPPAIKTPPAPPPAPPAARPPAPPFQQQLAHGRGASTGTTTTISSGNARETPLVSPLQMTFDFELPPRSPFSESSKPSLDSLRPKTSDGLGTTSRKSNAALSPQLLPPIPRVASRNEKVKSTVSYESGGSDSEAMSRSRGHRDDGDNVSISSKKSVKSTKSTASRKSFKIFEMTIDELNKAPSLPSTPVSATGNARPITSHGIPKMEGTLFPKATDAPVLPPLRTMTTQAPATMDRNFIDSRDRPFQPAPKMPAAQMQASSSTPDLSSTLKGGVPNFSQKSPLTPQTPATSSPLTETRTRAGSLSSTPKVLQKKASRPDMQGKRAQSNLSGTTARSKDSGKAKDGTPTVGTPYAETSPSFPLPQHVATRPKTAGAASTIAGINVPTHHTSSQPPSRPETGKAEKRKTKFLNPMAMFSRRKSAQNEAEVQREMAAQEAALARQKDVAAAGVRKPDKDFDPRIKGKVVHDFSAPNRQSVRSFTFNDAAEGLRGHQSKLQSAYSAPVVPALTQDGVDLRQSTFSGNSSTSAGTRKSMHAPVFVEHLSDTPMGANRVNADRAETLANRDFLQRASHVSNVSQESGVLPPFARRSQVMDPMQAAYFVDDGSKRSSDPSSSGCGTEKNRDSGVSSLSSVSPITARNSIMPPEPLRQSMSPISPTSPSRTGFGAGPRPKSMASSHLRESTYIDEDEELPQQRPPLQRNAASEQDIERIPSPPNRSAPPPPPERTLSPSGPISPSVSPAFSNISTPTEEQVANTVRMSKPPSSPPRVVEKRASAVGHGKKGSGTPKHHVSNASRFSFQMGASAAEELALEEKARKMRSGMSGFSGSRGGKAGSPSEEDEDEYFDEDAMDDMDEMELQDGPDDRQAGFGAQQSQQAPLANATLPSHINVPPRQYAIPPAQASPGVMNVNDARLQLMVSESDAETMSGEDESASEGGYYDFVDYGSVSHSRGASITTDQSRKASVQGGSQVASPMAPRFPQVDEEPPQAQHQRILSDDSALTLNTNIQPSGQGNAAFAQDSFSPNDSVPGGVGGAKPRSGFYMQPAAAGYSPTTTDKSPLGAARDSANTEKRNTSDSAKPDAAAAAANPMQTFANKHKPANSNSTMGSSSDSNKRPFSDATIGAGSSSRSSGPRTGSTGLGLSGFSDFHFSDSPENSRPVSKAFQNENRLTGDSETIPQHGWMAQHRKRGSSPLIPSSERNSKGSAIAGPGAEHRYTGSMGKNLQARKSSLAEFFNADADAGTDGDDEDDMYFDGGGFEDDLQTGKQDLGATMNEEVFDDDRFQRGQPMMNGFAPAAARPPSHPPPGPPPAPRPVSGMGLGADGPYPSFAMPNPIKARQRDSQLLLEDLVLQQQQGQQHPVDPRYIPQRNPSEDAKRLGLSSKVPPLPPQPGNLAAADRVQSNLQAYHAALAEAANRAASEGRFVRMPSVASTNTVGTQRSASVYSKAPDGDEIKAEAGDEPMPVDAMDAVSGAVNEHANGNGNGEIARSGTQHTTTSTVPSDLNLNTNTTYSPPKMSFDFGFDTAPLVDFSSAAFAHHDNEPPSSSFDDALPTDSPDLDDDDIISAANASALASDDAAFYGQEFGFFAKARPNSSQYGSEAVNGGFFGEVGDDGLSRERSAAEPNLTPITERSEFSTRNSFIGSGGLWGPPSAGGLGGGMGMASPALARLPVSPLMEGSGDITSFDQLKKLRMNAFGGSNASLGSNSAGGGGSHRGSGVGGQGHGYFGAAAAAAAAAPGGGSPMQWGYSSASDGSGGSAPGSAHPGRFSNGGFHDSPASAGAGGENRISVSSPLTEELTSTTTPRKPHNSHSDGRPESPVTARKTRSSTGQGYGHSRQSSNADSVTYVREEDGEGGQGRWVLERRRTSERGLEEVVGREVVRGGWI